MSRFFSEKYSSLVPYTPGEQPRDMKYVKLNTNESPYMPSKQVLDVAKEEAKRLHLYSDPEATILTSKIAETYGVDRTQVIVTNGSDEALNFAFMAFCDKNKGIVFPDITYGFYTVFADINNVPYRQIPLRDDFTINVNDYLNLKENIVLANPNAPTGICLSLDEIEKIVASNKDNVVIIDEAYIDFGGESATKLVEKYDNLLVTMTFSKSRSMAGGRVGFAIGQSELIRDLNTIKYSTNPYNVNRLSQMCALAILSDNDYYMSNCKEIIKTREYTVSRLTELGFYVLPSLANFVFAKNDKISGEELYKELKKRGVLVRHFTKEKINSYNRITIGTREQMDILLEKIKEILEEAK